MSDDKPPGSGTNSEEKLDEKDEDEQGPNSAPGSSSTPDPKDSRGKAGRKFDIHKNWSRDGRPTPFSKFRGVKGHASMEETKISQGSKTNKVNRPKSASMDAMGQKLSNGNLNNNTETKKDNHFLQSWLLRSNKITPAVLQEVVNVSPVIVESHQGASVGETCINISITKSNDSMENICRICHDSPSTEKLIKPCCCKGSMGTVHRTCLERWLGESGKAACEICGQEYNTVRVPKYKGLRSLFAWIKNPFAPTDSRNLFFDLACFFILTPLACLSAWLCVIGAQNYVVDHKPNSHPRRKVGNETLEMRSNRDASNSTWTSVGLLSLTGTLVAAYYIWIFVAIRYHLQVWKEWQLRNYIVTIVPLANGTFCIPPPPQPRPRDNHDRGPGPGRQEREGSQSPTRRRGQHYIRTLNVIDGSNNNSQLVLESNQVPDTGSGVGLGHILRSGRLPRSGMVREQQSESGVQVIQQVASDNGSPVVVTEVV